MRGVTLDEISAATKISVRSLQALEEGHFSKLPGGIFTRSFIRAYAEYLGLDPETVVAEYQMVARPPKEPDFSRLSLTKPPRLKEGSKAPIVALLIAAGLLGGGYALFRYAHNISAMRASAGNPARSAGEPSPSSAQARQPAAASQENTATPALPAATSGTPPAPGSESTNAATTSSLPVNSAAATRPAAPPEVAAVAGTDSPLVLQVAATEQAWVAIDADSKTALQRVLAPKEIETIKAKASFDVLTGNAQGIILTLNGVTLKPLGHRGEVKKIHLTRDDLKNNAP